MDDCPPMGDHAQYREIMIKLFLDGDDPSQIWWIDHDGKKHRLSEPSRKRTGGAPSKKDLADLDALNKRMAEVKKAAELRASEVASTSNE